MANFTHHQSAHCESGVTSNLLKNSGVELSEAMSFGIGGGLFFIHIPFVKVMGLPLTSYRSFPGMIFKKTCRRLKISFEYQKYRSQPAGEKALDNHLANGQAVGLRSNIYWLPYIPQQFRFQFNGHNLVVFDKMPNDTYAVSDPVLEDISVCSAHALSKARFAKGILAPKGLLFFPKKLKKSLDQSFPQAIHAGIQEVVRRMLFSVIPFAGVGGIRYMARRISRWPSQFPDIEIQKLQMANVVRMQEEIGTGGAGFRYLYAAFLQEAGQLLNNQILLEASKKMSEIGDEWRNFATLAAQFCKGRLEVPYEDIPKLLYQIADQEQSLYQDLRGRYL